MSDSNRTPLRAVRIDDALWEAVREQAASEGITISELIRRLLARHLARKGRS